MIDSFMFKGLAMSHLSKLASGIVTVVILAAGFVLPVYAEDETGKKIEKGIDKKKEEKSSPWIATPLISADPKLSTALGGLVAYLHDFDEESPSSMFGIRGTYSTSDSFILAAFGQMFFDNNNQRALVALAKGRVNNDYDDYLGSGIPLETTDDINFAVLQYSHRVYGDWFFGGQGIRSNYKILSAEEMSQGAFSSANTDVTNDELTELAGFESVALGLVAEFDDRDKPRTATSGQLLKISNAAYREDFGGDVNFDAYIFKYSTYYSHGNGHVLAIGSNGRWTTDAPLSGYSSINIKGYTRGQFLGPHSTDIQIDERINLTNDWGMIAYVGLACLYGDIDGSYLSCSDSDNIYPSVSVGVTYTINQEEGIVIRSEIAKGKGSSQGFYMTFGHPF